MPGSGNSGPSGMAFDSDGASPASSRPPCHTVVLKLTSQCPCHTALSTGLLLVANWGNSAIEVLDASGVRVARIRCPFRTPGNLCFVPNSRHVLVSEHDYHAVWAFGWRATGQPLFAEGEAAARGDGGHGAE